MVLADEPTLRGADWVSQQWHAARLEVTGKLGYWRERNREVDFVVKPGRRVTAIEVAPLAHPGLAAFAETFKPSDRGVSGSTCPALGRAMIMRTLSSR